MSGALRVTHPPAHTDLRKDFLEPRGGKPHQVILDFDS
jgi:hypothetical protein